MSRKIVGVTVGTPISPEKLKEKLGLGSGGNVDQSAKTAFDAFMDNTDVDYAYDVDTGAY